MTQNIDDQAKGLFAQFWQGLKSLVAPVERKVVEVDEWSGAASSYDSTDAYCAACLIDVNAAAGRDEKTQSHCMLPVKSPGSSSMADKAIFAAAGGRGIGAVKKPDDVPQDDWNAAVKKAAKTIVSAYEEMDREAPEGVMDIARGKTRALSMGDVFEKVWYKAQERYPMAYLHDIYADSDNSLFAILSSDGRLYRSPVTVQENQIDLAEWVEVVQEFRPVETRTKIIRQADGRARWFSISATSVLNRVGEIDSQALFDSFITHATQTSEYPYRTFYHKGEAFRTGQADFLARDGNCYITSGLYDDSDIARAEQEAIEREPDYWGESIGYLPTSAPQLLDVSGVKIPVYRSGIHLEISTLPEREAANLFTVIRQEVNRMMTANEMTALIKLFGSEEKARQWLEENVDATNRAIDQAGMITRAQDDPQDQPQEPGPIEIDDEVLELIVKRVNAGEVFTSLGEALAAINETTETLGTALANLLEQVEKHQRDVTERLAKLEKGETQKRAEWLQDLPAKPNVTRVTMKSRFEQQPDDGQPQTSSDVANQTLAKLPTC